MTLLCTSHFFACQWMVVGLNGTHGESSWILQAKEEVNQHQDFLSIYTSAFYLVILTFTSVGYGDIRAETENEAEMMFSMLVMMVGIVFYGYMLGTFQQIMSEIQSTDLKTEVEEKLDMFIIQLG